MEPKTTIVASGMTLGCQSALLVVGRVNVRQGGAPLVPEKCYQPPPPPPPDDPPLELPPPLPFEPLELGAETPAASPLAAAAHSPLAPAPPDSPPPNPLHDADDDEALDEGPELSTLLVSE